MEYMTSWERKGFEKGRREGEIKGRREGEIKGELKGEIKGRREGKLELVLELLPHRVGELSAAMRKRISKLSAAQLESLAKALFDFRRKADLGKWLKENVA